MSDTSSQKLLPVGLRLLIGLAGLPSLLLAVMLSYAAVTEGVSNVGAFEVLYAIAGGIALYIAITGRRLF
ncbi:hypothetical protein [Alteromonas sp. H39]|uniref:hypothetical protein n=1 Tax=Alteromonas sp. H39 TaxID=3389876 RepID=UPI0039DF60D0